MSNDQQIRDQQIHEQLTKIKALFAGASPDVTGAKVYTTGFGMYVTPPRHSWR